MCTSVNTHTHIDHRHRQIGMSYKVLLLPFVQWTGITKMSPDRAISQQRQPTSAGLNSLFSFTEQSSCTVSWNPKTRIQPRKENSKLSSVLSSGLQCCFPAGAGRDVVIQKVDSGVHSCNLTHQICKTLKTCWLQKGNANPLLLSGGHHPRNVGEFSVWCNQRDYGNQLVASQL